MVTVFGILNLTEDSFFDESRRLDPAGAVTAAIEMLRVGSDVVDVGPAASHPDARPVSPADEIRRIAPLLDALSDQMHRVSIDSFQPETQRYALKRGVGYLNDIQGFPDPALYPDIAEADCRRHCCKVSDEAAFCLIQRPYISKTLLTRRISPRGSP